VILNCVFGIDIDPVAMELSKLALGLETGGLLSMRALDRNMRSRWLTGCVPSGKAGGAGQVQRRCG
jgi:hypothetical protein